MKVYSAECDPACGFMVRSHDKPETMKLMENHAKSAHHKDVSDVEMQGMIKEIEM